MREDGSRRAGRLAGDIPISRKWGRSHEILMCREPIGAAPFSGERPLEPRAPPGFDIRGDRRVDPAIAGGDQAIPGEQQRQARALFDGNLAACSSVLSVCVRARAPGRSRSPPARARSSSVFRQPVEIDGAGGIVDRARAAAIVTMNSRSSRQRHDFATISSRRRTSRLHQVRGDRARRTRRAPAQATSGCASARASSSGARHLAQASKLDGSSTPARAMNARSALRRRATGNARSAFTDRPAPSAAVARSAPRDVRRAMPPPRPCAARCAPAPRRRLASARESAASRDDAGNCANTRVSAFDGILDPVAGAARRAYASISRATTPSSGRAMRPRPERRDLPASRRDRRHRRRETTAAAASRPGRRDAAR